MPRVRAVYERKTKWRKHDVGYDGSEPRSKNNYTSAEAHLDAIRT